MLEIIDRGTEPANRWSLAPFEFKILLFCGKIARVLDRHVLAQRIRSYDRLQFARVEPSTDADDLNCHGFFLGRKRLAITR